MGVNYVMAFVNSRSCLGSIKIFSGLHLAIFCSIQYYIFSIYCGPIWYGIEHSTTATHVNILFRLWTTPHLALTGKLWDIFPMSLEGQWVIFSVHHIIGLLNHKNIERQTAHTIVSWPNPKHVIILRKISISNLPFIYSYSFSGDALSLCSSAIKGSVICIFLFIYFHRIIMYHTFTVISIPLKYSCPLLPFYVIEDLVHCWTYNTPLT